MIKIIISFYFFLSIQTAFAQIPGIDSVLQKIAAEKEENKRIDLINDFIANTAEIDPVLALKKGQSLLSTAQKNNDRLMEAMALTEIGYNYRAFGNTSKSLDYSLKASTIAAATGNEKLMAYTDVNLAHNYKDQTDYPKAIRLYLSVVEKGGKLNDYMVQTWAFNSLGQVYMEINKLDSALMYSQRAYELCIRIHHTDFITNVLRMLGSIHGRMGNRTLAVSYFDMAIKEAYRINSIRWISESYTSLAQFYHDGNQVDSCLAYAKKAIAVVKNTAFSNKSIKAAKLLMDIYETTNSDSALKYFKLYKVTNDSLFNAKVIQQTQVMTFENEVHLQELANEEIKAAAQRKQNIQYVLIALGIITFIILFLLLSRSFITNTKLIEFLGVIALLIVFEFLNLLLHPFLGKVTGHSPLLLLLALVCIAALLVPLHHRTQKWASHKLIEKNKKIRLAAAKKTIEKLEGKTNMS